MRRAYGWVGLAGLLASAVVGVGPLVEPAAACSCLPSTAAETLARADVQLVGTVVSSVRSPAADVATFAVAVVRRGSASSQERVGLFLPCGGEGWTQGNYVVVASRAEEPSLETGLAPGQLQVPSCGVGAVRPLSDQESLALGLPVPGPQIEEDDVTGAAVVASALVALLCGGLLLIGRPGVPAPMELSGRSW